jgi:hypothetical protein
VLLIGPLERSPMVFSAAPEEFLLARSSDHDRAIADNNQSVFLFLMQVPFVLAGVALALKTFAAFSSPFSLLTMITNLVGTGCEGHEAAPRPRGCPASSACPERSRGCGKSFHTCKRSGVDSPGPMRRVWRECTFRRTITSSLGRFGNPHFRMPGVQTSNPAHRDRIGVPVLRIGFGCTSANWPEAADSKNQLWLHKDFVGDSLVPQLLPLDGASLRLAIRCCPRGLGPWRADGQHWECLCRGVHW